MIQLLQKEYSKLRIIESCSKIQQIKIKEAAQDTKVWTSEQMDSIQILLFQWTNTIYSTIMYRGPVVQSRGWALEERKKLQGGMVFEMDLNT